ncbi:MAG: S8 family serine peptidase, partial [Clostridia bacterium]|nr:S8 family serine peptidase [Clostridia bacterium]
MNIKIAIIDTGISKAFDKKVNINHFYLYNNEIINGYKEPIGHHGTFCLKEILKQKVAFDIVDINIANDCGELQLKGIILGIKKSIEERADIINISLGVDEHSEELYRACQEAVEHNIAIISAASHSGEVSYPADLKNVVSIQIHSEHETEKIKKIDDSTLSVYMSEDIVQFGNSTTALNCTSMAAANFSGVLGKKLDGVPFYDKFFILKKDYGLKLDSSKNYLEKLNYKKCRIYNELENKRVAVVMLPSQKFQDVDNCMKLGNIVAFYDHDLKAFCSLEQPPQLEHDFDVIVVINTKESKAKISDEISTHFKNREIICLGEFKGNIADETWIHKHEDFYTENLAALRKPVILISGIGANLNKFDVQTNLMRNFAQDHLSPKAITYNPAGSLYGYDIFKYPTKVIFPDIVCSINNYMCAAEEKKNFDVWIINVGGGCFFINNQNKNIFGKLITSYLDACNVDVFILCINNFVDVETLKFYILKLK